jgi:general secretion pathway protein B
MSLILEALRKSEAERRRGNTPDVAMELPPVPAARTRNMPAWVLPASVIAIVALLAGAWWSQHDSGGDTATPIAASPVAEPAIDASAQLVVVARPAPATAAPATTPPAAAAPPASHATVDEPPPRPIRAMPPAPAPAPAYAGDVADIGATSLPPVKLSMHMWDAAPARRFVILDGQRLAEGERHGELTVIAIERDGVVVERGGQRARVPLP